VLFTLLLLNESTLVFTNDIYVVQKNDSQTNPLYLHLIKEGQMKGITLLYESKKKRDKEFNLVIKEMKNK
jgi:hypothetical protein